MKTDPSKTDKGRVPVPDSLFDILITRGKWEEEKIQEIKIAYDAGDREKVFALVGELLYTGPGTMDTP
jgi:hypothetical protein